MSYTKGKWTVELNGVAGDPNEYLIEGHPNSNDDHIIETVGKTFSLHNNGKENAERICHCVNSHDALLEACKKIASMETKFCSCCKGNGRLYADGKPLYADGKPNYSSEIVSTILCGDCGGSGRILPEDAQQIAEKAIALAKKTY